MDTWFVLVVPFQFITQIIPDLIARCHIWLQCQLISDSIH